MKKFACTLVTASVLTGSFAFAQTAKQALADNQMDRVTAGSSVAVDNSSVTSTNVGATVLGGSSLSGADAGNIVNSSDSLVSNSINANVVGLVGGTGKQNGETNQINVTKQSESSNAQIAADITLPSLSFTGNAAATNLAGDSSSVKSTAAEVVDLSGSAESNAAALNIVNAAGSVVSNSINLNLAGAQGAATSLNQINVTTQTR
jgi:hypothetical protein